MFLSNLKNGGSPLLSIFSFYSLSLLSPVATKKLEEDLRDLTFWALNLGLPHEEKPTNLPLSDYVEGLVIPTIEQQTSSFSFGKDIVNISESL